MVKFSNELIRKLSFKRRKIEPNDVGLYMCRCINELVYEYYKERNFNFASWDDKFIEKKILLHFKEKNNGKRERCIKKLSLNIDEKNEVITLTLDFIYFSFEHQYELTFDVDEIRSMFKELDIVSYEKNELIRYAGELICFIKNVDDRKLDDKELYDNRYESNRGNSKVYYTGNMIDGLPEGKGKLNWKDGKLLYEGDFKEGKITGYGTTYLLTGGVSEIGSRINGELNGSAITYYENGQINYKGNYKDGIYHGHGISYYSDSKLQYDGEWSEGWAIEGIIIRSINGINYRYTDEGIFLVNKNNINTKKISMEELDNLLIQEKM